MYYTQSGTEMGNMRRSAKEDTMHWATPEDCRLMDEALARAVALGRPFEEQEVFEPAWKLGYELHPALDESRFQMYQEARWQGRGDKKKLHPRLWVVRTDEQVAIEESLDNGELTIPDLEATIARRRLSVRASAQIDCENGELEVCDEDGIHVYSMEEALELRELLNSQYGVMYALANQGES